MAPSEAKAVLPTLGPLPRRVAGEHRLAFPTFTPHQTFAGVAGGMVLVGLLAVYLLARRASRVDPMESLRGE